jgi:ATP-dependent DNA helicase RecG
MEPPKFIDDIGVFQAEFPNHTLLDQDALDWLGALDGRPLTRAQMTALVQMRNGGQLTNNSFRSITGIQDSRAAHKELKELVDRGLIFQFGTRGSTYYELSAEDGTHDGTAQTMPLSDDGTGLTELQKHVYSTLRNGSASRQEITERTGLDDRQVMGILRALRSKGLISMMGKPRSKNATWRIG